jgi:hypothetical protein
MSPSELRKIIKVKKKFAKQLEDEIDGLRIRERDVVCNIHNLKLWQRRGLERIYTEQRGNENQLNIIKTQIKRTRQVQFQTLELLDYLVSELIDLEFRYEIFV